MQLFFVLSWLFAGKTLPLHRIIVKMALEETIFSRSELLLGYEAMERLAQKRVILFGVGGVGS